MVMLRRTPPTTRNGSKASRLILLLSLVIAFQIFHAIRWHSDCPLPANDPSTRPDPNGRHRDDAAARRERRRASLRNTLARVRARNAYLRPGNHDASQWGWKTGGTGRFQEVPRLARSAQVSSVALQPTASCPGTLRRTNVVSEAFDGGKWTCGLREMRASRPRAAVATPDAAPPCVVYSFGSNGDDVFEDDVRGQDEFCEIHVFDPTSGDPPSSWEGKYRFHKLGLCAGNETTFTLEGTHTVTRGGGAASAAYPCASLPDIMRELGHAHVDVLKADVEGMEWPLLRRWGDDAPLRRVGQLLLELHFWHAASPQRLPPPHGTHNYK